MPRNIRLILEYDGTDFKGWQVQPAQRTVQGELETALRRLVGARVRVTAAGRTDAGVHALGQVANFHTASALPAERIHRALNAVLPADIAVRSAEEAPLEFHARRDAIRREYLYRIRFHRRAVGRSYAWWVRIPLDVVAMQTAAEQLRGHHDFTSFCVAAAEKENRNCRVFACDWQQVEDELVFRISADRFLRSMVRSIVGTLVDVGRGAMPAAEMGRILNARNRQVAGPSAPPQGLFLDRVCYGGIPKGDLK